MSAKFDSFLISSDIHISNPKDSTSMEFSVLLDSFSLSQHMSEPTHNRGHTLDLIISKGLVI